MDMKFEPPEFGVSFNNITDNKLKTAFFTSNVLQSKMKEFLSQFDQIFICTSDKEAFSRIRALEKFNPTLVLLSKIKKTRKKYIQMIKQALPIEVMLHE